jgi:ribosomal protein S18 acetylase RimI-like enzyme
VSSSPSPAGSSDVRLDRPIWHSLVGRHAALAQPALAADGTVLAARYLPEVSPFAAVGEVEDRAGWAALSDIVEPGGRAVVMLPFDATDGIRPWPPAGWGILMDLPGVQMVAADMRPQPDPGALTLGPGDVSEMLDLVARTRPGPFEKRTIEFGGYVGFRQGATAASPTTASPASSPPTAPPAASTGRLVAMAGRRFAPGGFVEMSAVCTDADQRGRGLGSRLVKAVAAGIVADGDVPFLHAAATNPAIELYRQLGMVVRLSVRFVALQRTE